MSDTTNLPTVSDAVTVRIFRAELQVAALVLAAGEVASFVAALEEVAGRTDGEAGFATTWVVC